MAFLGKLHQPFACPGLIDGTVGRGATAHQPAIAREMIPRDYGVVECQGHSRGTDIVARGDRLAIEGAAQLVAEPADPAAPERGSVLGGGRKSAEGGADAGLDFRPLLGARVHHRHRVPGEITPAAQPLVVRGAIEQSGVAAGGHPRHQLQRIRGGVERDAERLG